MVWRRPRRRDFTKMAKAAKSGDFGEGDVKKRTLQQNNKFGPKSKLRSDCSWFLQNAAEIKKNSKSDFFGSFGRV